MKKLPLLKQERKNSFSLVNSLKSRFASAGLLFVFTAMLFSLIGCSSLPGQVDSELGKKFTLAINQTAVIKSDNLSIKFVDINDSRCPTGATCIWAGEARAFVEINGNTGSNISLTEGGGSANGSENATIGAYTFVFHVRPYPALSHPLTKTEYRLDLTVTK